MNRQLLLVILFLSLPFVSHAQARDLDYYLEQARQNSPLVHKSTNEHEIISLDLVQVKRVLSRPEINLEGNILFAPIVSHDGNKPRFEWVSGDATNYYGYDLALTDGGQYQAGIAIMQPLLTGSAFRSYSDKAGISQEINQNNLDLTIHELEQLVGYQYILCMKAKAQAKNSLWLLDQMEDQLSVMKKLVDNSIYKQTDRMLLQIERTNYDDAYRTSQADYRSSLYDLNLICGIRDTTLVDIGEVPFRLNTDPLVQSRFIHAFILDSLNLLADQLLYEQKYIPRLYWYASAGLGATYIPGFDRLGFGTGLSFSWTIFDGRQREIERQKTAINLNSVEFERMNFITKTDIQKHKLITGIQSLEQRETLAREQLDQYSSLISAYLAELSLGSVSIMDLKNLVRDMAAKQQQLVVLEMEKYTLINSYNYWNY
jgi:outer membrane protein TolC